MFIKKTSEWRIINTFETSDETLYQIRIGKFDEHRNCSPNYDILMRKSTYAKLISGKYTIDRNSKKFRLLDSRGHYVPKITFRGLCCEAF